MATRNYVLQRCMRRTATRLTWETVAPPVTYREGLAQLAAVEDHHRPHRLLVGVPEALCVGSRLSEAAPKQKELSHART